ncbi:unnamed protein product [Cutaneotrichosporon oleaginosum]
MPPVPTSSESSTHGATIAVGVGVGVGLALLILLVVAVAFIIWRRHMQAYDSKPREIHRYASAKSPREPTHVTPLPQHGRRESEQSENERRGLLRSSPEIHLPIWEQRHTLPPTDSPPSLYNPSPTSTPELRRVYFSLPGGTHLGLELPDIQPSAEPSVDASSSRHTPRSMSLPPPPRGGKPVDTGKNRASLPAISEKSVSPERNAQWLDLSKRPDLLPPIFLPPHLRPEASQPQPHPQPIRAATASVDAARASQTSRSSVGLSKFAAEWRENAAQSDATPRLSVSAAPVPQVEATGACIPVCMEKLKDEPSTSDNIARLRLQSFASASGSLSTGSVSSEGALEMRSQLCSSLQFPIPQPLAVPKEVKRHQPIPTHYLPRVQATSVAIEEEGEPSPCCEPQFHRQTLDALHGDLGLGYSSTHGSGPLNWSSPSARPHARGDQRRSCDHP